MKHLVFRDLAERLVLDRKQSYVDRFSIGLSCSGMYFSGVYFNVV